MYQSVLSHFDKFPEAWNQLVPIVPVVDNLRRIVADMLTQSQLQAEHETVGYTKRKDVHVYEILDHAYRLSLKLRAYAKVHSDHVLLQAVNYSQTALKEGAGQLVLQRCQRIAQHARTHLAELATYNVTEADVATLEQLLATAEPMAPAAHVIAGARKAATKSIPELIGHARQQLNLLDDLIEGMVADTVFVDTYFNVRQVVDRTARGTQEKTQQ